MARRGGGSDRRRRSAPAATSGGGGGILGAVGGFVGNLAGDVKDAVVGLPVGMIELARNPVGSTKAIGAATWQTWSPLFSGDFGKFGKQLYDHPLAPLLDVATVFTLGAGGAARGASALSKAGSTSKTVKAVAGLRESRFQTLKDPTGKGRHDIDVPLSRSAGRRLTQMGRLRFVEPHLPKWYADNRYEREFMKDIAHRSAAKADVEANALQYVGVLKAGKALEDPATRQAAFREIASNIWQGLDRHAPHKLNTRFVTTAKGTTRFAKPPEGYRYLLDHEKLMARVDKRTDPESFERLLRSFGHRVTTRDPKLAARRQDGTVPLVRIKDAQDLGIEGANSSKAVRWLWRNPTRLWKMALLGWTPRTLTNNGVGNWALYAARQGGHGSLIGIYDAIRLTKGEHAAKKLNQPMMYGAKNEAWIRKWHLDELGNTFKAAVDADLGLTSKTGKAKRIASQGIYPAVHAISDKPVRVAALAAFYRKHPDVQRLMKGNRMSFDQAVDAALTQNPRLREEASRHARSIAGDYVTMRSWERVARDVVPFYLWDRHIVKTAGNMLLDQPGRVAAIQRVSNLGLERTEEILGEIPEFLRGAIPFELLGLGSEGGRANVFLTASLNPFATLSELAAAGEALTTGGGPRPGSAIAGQLNPLISGAAEFFSGQDLLTGAPRDSQGGLLTDIIANAGETLPQTQLVEALTTADTATTAKGNPLLYARDDTRVISSLLGIPIRNVSLARARELAEQLNS